MAVAEGHIETLWEVLGHIEHRGQSPHADIESAVHQELHDLRFRVERLELFKKCPVDGQVITGESIAQLNCKALPVVQ